MKSPVLEAWQAELDRIVALAEDAIERMAKLSMEENKLQMAEMALLVISQLDTAHLAKKLFDLQFGLVQAAQLEDEIDEMESSRLTFSRGRLVN